MKCDLADGVFSTCSLDYTRGDAIVNWELGVFTT